MKKLTIATVVILTTCIIGCVSKTGTETEIKAINSAQSWLKLVDNGKYLDSWKKTTDYFKSIISEKKFKKDTSAVRIPLGKVISRKLLSATSKSKLPGAPDGEYVIIKYNTSFKNKKLAIETIILKLAKNNSWKVDGYFIRQLNLWRSFLLTAKSQGLEITYNFSGDSNETQLKRTWYKLHHNNPTKLGNRLQTVDYRQKIQSLAEYSQDFGVK